MPTTKRSVESRPGAICHRKLIPCLTGSSQNGCWSEVVTLIEVALESLFRQWGELNGWLEDARDNLKSAEALERSATEWHANNLNAAWLIGGTRLEDAETLARTPGFRKRLSTIDDYIAASRDAENKRLEAEEHHRQAELEAAKERAQAAHERQATAEAHAAILRKRSRVLVFVLVATAVLAIAALVGATAFARANGQAQKRFREATAQRLISQSQQILDGSPLRQRRTSISAVARRVVPDQDRRR